MDDLDRKILVALSGDLEVEQNPYRAIAEELGLELEELIERLKKIKEKGYLKRVAPVIRHRRTDYRFNGMAVFMVSGGDKDKLIERLKGRSNISHVYERETSKLWPYNVYGMTHGKSREEVEETVESVLKDLDIECFKILYSTKEYKKTSPNIEHLLEG
jgi:siroheme decarboxylase